MSHAGNELTADDFIYKLKRGEAVQGISWGFFNRMGIVKSEQVQKLGKYTIKITLEEPNALFLPLLANQALVLYDSVEAQKHATDDDPWATKWMANTLVAHGPWKVESFSPGRETVFARHEDYFGAKPSVQKIVAKEIPASANRLALLLAGAIDVATDLLPIEMQNAGQAPGVRLDSWEANLFDFIGMNAHSGPFSDVRVRQAVSWAIPYDEIQQTVYLGTASQLKSLIPSIFPCYQPEFWQYTFDPEKARSMLGDAGYPDGFSTKIQIDAADPVAELIAIVTGAALEQAGVTAAIEKLPTGDFYALFNGGYEGLWIIRDGPGTYDVSWPPVVWAQTGGLANSGRYSNPDLDEVIEKLRQPGPEQERCKLAEEVQRIVVQEDPIWLFVGAPGYNLGVGSNVKDAMWHLTGGSRWQHMQKF